MNKLKWIICSCSEGNGVVENPAFSNGFTSREWQDMQEDEQAAYMAGEYDVSCEQCQGSGKVQVPDVSRMTFGEKRLLVIERRGVLEDARLDREMLAEMAAERAIGC